MFTRSSHAATTLHLLVVGLLVVNSTTAMAQVVVLPNCNFQEVNLLPCMAPGGAAAAGGNISNACCSSLNKALDAGHRCVCSLLLSNDGVFASLVTNLLTLPLVLPLPGCFLYAHSLAACQATLQQQMSAPPAAASTGDGAAAVLPLPAQAAAAAATPPVNKHPGREQAGDDGRTRGSISNGGSEAPSPTASVSSSDARRHHSPAEGRACILTFVVAVAVLWFNRISYS